MSKCEMRCRCSKCGEPVSCDGDPSHECPPAGVAGGVGWYVRTSRSNGGWDVVHVVDGGPDGKGYEIIATFHGRLEDMLPRAHLLVRAQALSKAALDPAGELAKVREEHVGHRRSGLPLSNFGRTVLFLLDLVDLFFPLAWCSRCGEKVDGPASGWDSRLAGTLCEKCSKAEVRTWG